VVKAAVGDLDRVAAGLGQGEVEGAGDDAGLQVVTGDIQNSPVLIASTVIILAGNRRMHIPK